MSHRSWFPPILVGLSLLLGLVFVVALKGDRVIPQFPHEASTPKISEADYQSAANVILDAYAEDHDASRAYNALILLRVPKEEQEVHFDLVVAFGKLMTKETKEGEARLSALKAAHPWLHL
jgi:hypothetical protein